MCGCLSHVSYWLATQADALTGNPTVILWFTVRRSIHWATPARRPKILVWKQMWSSSLEVRKVFFNIFYWLCCYSCLCFIPFAFFCLVTPFLAAIDSLSSCPWFVHVSSLAIPFPILSVTSPCLFCAYQFVLLNPCTSSLVFPLTFPLPADSPPTDLHIYNSVPILLVCLVCLLDSVFDSCEFVAILMFIVLIFFFLFSSL